MVEVPHTKKNMAETCSASFKTGDSLKYSQRQTNSDFEYGPLMFSTEVTEFQNSVFIGF